MNDILLLKQGEIVLKGLNRRIFEEKLIANVRRRMARVGQFRVYAAQSTVYVEPLEEGADMDAAFEAAKQIFGCVAVVRAAACEKTPQAIFETARDYLSQEFSRVRSFKVESKRSDKAYPMTSIQVSQEVGGLLSDAFPDVAVDVHDPELTVHVEIRENAAYVHSVPALGAGGLPVGSCGAAVSLLSGGIDSPVSTWMAAKRGVHIVPVHFFSFPYTSQLAKDKVVELARLLVPWCGRMTLEVVPFTHIQEEIRDKCPEEYFTVIMRRFMTRIAEKIALAHDCGAIVTGESLGQVASQTMSALGVTQEPVKFPVLRPLVCMDKREIVEIARNIGTFETSILPYEDCCTVFNPRHPRTKPRLQEVLEAEAPLDTQALVSEALQGIERIPIR